VQNQLKNGERADLTGGNRLLILMKARNQRLRQALKKFTAETLKPLSTEQLAALMSAFPSDLPARYSESLVSNISENCLREFEKIIDEHQLTTKLDALDELVARFTGFEINMGALQFQPADPEVVKERIVSRAKQMEIEKLEKILEQLNAENSALEARDAELKDQLRRTNAEIERQLNLVTV
jgi:hypothetical protein